MFEKVGNFAKILLFTVKTSNSRLVVNIKQMIQQTVKNI